MQQGPRVAVIGLDCGAPQLLFEDLADEVPNLQKIFANGMYGDLASITPPITVPAWACAMTGKTPGQLGIYGFRNRKDTSYDGLQVATSLSVKEPAVWDALGAAGQALAADRRAARLPAAEGVPGLACGLLPHAAERRAVRVPGGARDRDRGRAGGEQVHLRHPELPPAGRRLRDGSDLQDDRAPVPGGTAADQEQALGLLHDGRDGARPAAPLLLAVLRPEASPVRGRQQVRDRVP